MSGPFMTRRVDELGKAAAVRQGISLEQWRVEAEGEYPLGRFGDPLEYGELVAFSQVLNQITCPDLYCY